MRIVAAAEFRVQGRSKQLEGAALQTVREILAAVKKDGDAALRDYTRKFDHVEIEDFRVPEEHFASAYETVEDDFLQALREAIRNIQTFHMAQRRNSYVLPHSESSWLGQLIRPLQRVGVYVPGGTAAYPSSVLMNVIPAQVAGVREIVLASPAGPAGRMPAGVLVAARELGVQEVYRVGGAQAIGALAYGTETVPKVDKIVGPGNIYVALAKQQVFGEVGIESIAGPSDILIVADDSADPQFVAADLLSQAEHDELAQAILATPSRRLAERVQEEIGQQLPKLPRRQIAEAALQNRGAIVVCESIEGAIEVANRVAPEHLELLVSEPDALLNQIQNAGAVFIGPYSTEPVGDYFCGTNHILPTEGTARFSSALSVDDFVRKTSLIRYSKQDLLLHGSKIITLAESEGLDAHAQAIRIRLEKEGL